MNTLIRNTLVTLGLVFFVLAVAVLINPGWAVEIPLQAGIVTAIGLVLMFLGFWAGRVRWGSPLEQVIPPKVEHPGSTQPPGSDVDAMIRQLATSGRGAIEYRKRIRERLSKAAISVLRQRENITREEAITRLEEGTWTDDEYASAYFSGTTPPSAGSLMSQLSSLTGTNFEYEQWVRQTVSAIIEKAQIDVSEVETRRSPKDKLIKGGVGLLNRVGLTTGQADTTSLGANISGWVQENRFSPDPHEEESDIPDGGQVGDTAVRDIGRLRGVSLFGLALAGVGMAAQQPAVLVAGAVGIGYAAFTHLSGNPSHENLTVKRSLSDDSPSPGDRIKVTVHVQNDGSSTKWDLRLVDRVPDAFRVVNGSPRHGTTLRPGGATSFEYTVIVERGKYRWPVLAIERDFTSTVERESVIEVGTSVTSLPSFNVIHDMPVRAQTSVFSGTVSTQVGGEGLEFFQVRDYRPGDPLNRIDWNRRAQSGELATLEFRVERAATAVLLFDARDAAYLAPNPNVKHSLNRSVDAAIQVFSSLFDAGNPVGIAAFDTIPCWLQPGSTTKLQEEARLLLGFHPAIAPIPPSQKAAEGRYMDPMTHIRRQLSSHTQIIMFSPLCDDYSAEVAIRLDTAGHRVTVVSPDPTVDRTTGQRLAKVEREMRMHRLRESGIRILDWAPDEQFRLAIERTMRQMRR